MKLNERYIWLRKLLEILRELQENKYHVRRGAINWRTFTWPKQFAVSVRCPENFPPRGSNPRQTTLVLTVGTRIPDSDVKENLDDETLDALEQDMVDALSALSRAKKGSSSDNYVIYTDYQGSVEWHSFDFGVQGYVVTYTISF